MKLRKSSMLIIGLCVLVLSSMNVSAESDPTGDIYHQVFTDSGLSWDLFTGEKSYLDITDITYNNLGGSTAYLSMTFADDIQNSENTAYYMSLRSSEDSFYQVVYINEIGMFTGFGDYSGTYEIIEENLVATDGKSIVYTFELANPELEYEAWGWVAEYANIGETQGEAWIDYAPGTFAPWYNIGGDGTSNGGSGSGSGSGTPGFETLSVIAALGVAFIILRRRK